MSDRMSVTDAQAYLDTWSTGDSVDMWKVRAARTVVAQAEQIERLQEAIRAMSYPCAGELIGLIGKGVVRLDDMEPPA